MTKKDIVAQIAQESGIRQTAVKEVVQRMLDIVLDAVARGETVELRNFGVFKKRLRKKRLGRNPKTGDSVFVPERYIALFKPGLLMKKKVNSGSGADAPQS